ncbi:MAG: hypothetical protein A2504_07245 [Bdellovibrionales bacterium RIFOXYD12_FULL_39_22]|nr:MAG: hypothetical protein A2385_16615 [Bdellovibrionales bacterium RIFOXYB1_FULL_39_21]OFZ72596.1 MAG: hypothetical protein A2451_00750 [Bdellovibrionales bacterium RIFOXYC2_FULL_39_8]OFZ77039.1 MAG: hypothetical protein A2560_09735 [Bdellovibrionales bacterium RIFOXYD1_FULL_39_84]OFZ95299.1 MAG: hypothetical protein A2504_07245 [Bdellovibrionales bacterium RIFOXYD12_FULL_39_22]HLE13085.1 hypothetical protein [Bacteriovoracaceae bacterium]
MLLFFSVLFLSQSALAGIRLKIEVAHKKGINKSLFLESELHSMEELYNNESVSLKFEHGITIIVGVEFVEKNPTVAVVDFVKLHVKIIGNLGELLHDFPGDILVNIGETKKLEHTIKDQMIEISITPMTQL